MLWLDSEMLLQVLPFNSGAASVCGTYSCWECVLWGQVLKVTTNLSVTGPVSFPDLPGCEKAIPFRCLSLTASQFSRHAFPYRTDFYPLKIHISSLKLLVRYLVIATELTAYICIVSPTGRDMKNVYTPSYTNTSLQLEVRKRNLQNPDSWFYWINF